MTRQRTELDVLMAQAEAGGPGAALAARRAAWLAEKHDPARARAALALAARLEPFDAGPRLGLARLYAEGGDLNASETEARAVFDDAIDQAARARAAFMLGEIARVRGDGQEARNAYAAVIEIEDALLKHDRMNPHAARWYARARGRIAELDAGAGDFARARAGAEGALAMLKAAAAQISETPALAADVADGEMRLGALELDGGEPESARRRLIQAIARYEALVLHEPNEPHWRAVLADAWALAAEADYARGAPDEARAAIDNAMALRVKLANADKAERWALAGAWRVRAALLAALGDDGGAALSLVQARALCAQLCGEAPGAEEPARFFVRTLLDQADHALRASAFDVAGDAAQIAREVAEAFARLEGADAAWFTDLSAAWDRLGEIARAGGRPALDAFARAVEFRRMAQERTPDAPRLARALAAALLKAGDAHLRAREIKSARAAFNEAVIVRLRLAEAAAGDLPAAHDLAIALERAGEAAAADGDAYNARVAWESELDLADRLFEDDHAVDGLRFRAVIEAQLSRLGGVDSAEHRARALARLDVIAQLGQLTERDARLRKQLWSA